MWIYLLTLVVIWIFRKVHAEYTKPLNVDVSKNSVPLVKNSINALGMTSEKIFQYDRDFAKKFKRSYRLSFFGIQIYNVIRAKDAEKVLNSSKHNEKGFVYNFLHPFLKTGLLTSKGEKWHTRRRMLTPAFHFEILKEFFEVFREESDKLVEGLKEEVGKIVNIVPISTQFTLNTICESAMGVKLSNLKDNGVVYRNSIYEIGVLFLYRAMRPWLHPEFMYDLFGEKAKMDKVLEPVHSFTKSIIKERKANFKIDSENVQNDSVNDENVYFRSKKRRYAMMDTLLKAQRDGLIDDEGIMEETDTFTFEGHDTTSAAMTFTLLLMAHHPEAQKRIFEEIQAYKQENGELTIDEFSKMEYLDRAVKESMRIYPPVPLVSRVFSENFEHDGVTHKKGTTVQIQIFDIHRDPKVFPDPEKFDPDRFLPENMKGRSNFAFIAFSAGMRNCIGQKFALLEVKVMLTKIIESFKILPVTKREDVTFFMDLILRSKDPVKMKFELRK